MEDEDGISLALEGFMGDCFMKIIAIKS